MLRNEWKFLGFLQMEDSQLRDFGSRVNKPGHSSMVMGGGSCVIYFKQKDTSADASRRQADTETLTNHMTCGHRPGRAPDAIAAHACGHHHFQKLYAVFICQIRLQLNTSISDSFSLFNI